MTGLLSLCSVYLIGDAALLSKVIEQKSGPRIMR